MPPPAPQRLIRTLPIFPQAITSPVLFVGKPSALLAIEHIADGSTAGFVQFSVGLAIANGGARDAALFRRLRFFRNTARGAAIGEARLARAKFELFRADDTDFDGKSHKHP